MAFCTKCGSQIPDDAKFCTVCGTPRETAPKAAPEAPKQAPAPEASAPKAAPAAAPAAGTYQQAQPAPSTVIYQAPQVNSNPYSAPTDPRYSILSPWMYVLYFFLFSLPCIGLILLIVFAFTGDNENKKNFARGMLLYGIICAVLSIILSIVFAASISGLISSLMNDPRFASQFSGMF